MVRTPLSLVMLSWKVIAKPSCGPLLRFFGTRMSLKSASLLGKFGGARF